MNRISSCGTTHQANLGRARSYNEFAGTLKAREKDNLMCDRVEKDREWISGQMADVGEAAARFRRLNGTRADLAKDDPTRVVLDGAMARSFQRDLAIRVWHTINCNHVSPRARISGVASLGPDGQTTSLDCSRSIAGREKRMVGSFNDDRFSVETRYEDGFAKVDGNRNGEVDYQYYQINYHGGMFGVAAEPTVYQGEGRLAL